MTDLELDSLAEKIAQRIKPKDLWSSVDIAERWGVKPDFVRKRMAAGDFGELIHIGERTRFVPLAGLLAYEREHMRPTQKRTYKPRRAKRKHPDPGPI